MKNPPREDKNSKKISSIINSLCDYKVSLDFHKIKLGKIG